MTETKPASDLEHIDDEELGRRLRAAWDYWKACSAELNRRHPPVPSGQYDVHPDAIAKDPDAMELMRRSGSRNPIYGGPIAAPEPEDEAEREFQRQQRHKEADADQAARDGCLCPGCVARRKPR